MRKSAMFLSIGLFVLTAVSPAWSQSTTGLQYKMVSGSVFQDPLVSMMSVYFQPSLGRPADVKGEPAGATGELRYFTGQLGSRQVVMAMDSGSPPNLFVGKDGGNDFSGVKPVRREKSDVRFSGGPSWQYGPVSIKAPGAPEGAAARVLIANLQDSALMVYPAGYLVGKVKLGDKSYKIALVDGDFDGRYTVTESDDASPRGSDVLAMDLNGDGNFVYMANGKMEIRPLTPLVRVADKYYEVKIAADGTGLRMVASSPKMGTLSVGNDGVSLVVSGTGGMQYLESGKGEWKLPAGRYSCQSLTLTAKDKQGRKWQLDASGQTGKLKSIDIKPGQTLNVKVGSPLVVKTDVQQQDSGWIFRGKTVTVGFTIVGAAGEEYAPGAKKDGTQVSAPKIKIYNDKGEVLTTGDFAYG